MKDLFRSPSLGNIRFRSSKAETMAQLVAGEDFDPEGGGFDTLDGQ